MDKLSDKFSALKGLPSGLARRVAAEQPRKSQTPAAVADLKLAVARVEGKSKASEAVKRSRAKKPEEYRQKHRDYMRKRRKAQKENNERF